MKKKRQSQPEEGRQWKWISDDEMLSIEGASLETAADSAYGLTFKPDAMGPLSMAGVAASQSYLNNTYAYAGYPQKGKVTLANKKE